MNESAIDLRVFFERRFAPHRLSDRPARARFYFDAITWLARTIDRAPSLADVSETNLAEVSRQIAQNGFSPSRDRSIRVCLLAIARHAWRIGLRSDCPTIARAPKPTDHRPAFMSQPPGPDTLSHAFESQLRAELARRNADANAINAHAATIHRFNVFLDCYATVRDLTPENLDGFREHLRKSGRAASTYEHAYFRLRRVARLLAPDRFAIQRGKLAPLPPPESGTLRAFFEDVYRPQRLLGCHPTSPRDYRNTLRLLFNYRGRDVPVSELSDRFASDFLNWLLERDMRSVTVNGHRGRLLALWRLAAEHHLVDALPKVRKLPISVDVPDAWTPEETARIVAAPLEMNWRAPIAGIPAGQFWNALLLVQYWTGMRHGSLMKLRIADADLETGWLTVPGDQMKNRRGQRFRIGPDAIAALRRILEPPRGLLFPWPFDRNAFFKHYRRIIAAAEVAPSTRSAMTGSHKMRRTVATMVASARGIEAAATLLGHSSSEMTKRYVDPSRLPGRDATEFLPQLSPAAVEPLAPISAVDSPPAKRDLCRDARELLAAGHVIAAAMTGRVALERWIRSLGKRHHCEPANGQLGISQRAKSLYSLEIIDSQTYHQVCRITKTANSAAHGRKVSTEQVAELLETVQRLCTPNDPTFPSPTQPLTQGVPQ